MKALIRRIPCFRPFLSSPDALNIPEPASAERDLPLPATPNYERIICTQLLKGVPTLEVVRNALLKSSQDLRSEQQAIDELNARNSSARQSLENLVALIGQIDMSVSQNTDSLIQFKCSFGEINKYINDINQLSRQTNLIAINSAIEAAHVGSKGAGFSVIAKEIKFLSEQVNNSANSISALTRAIESSAGNVCEGVADQRPVIERINADLNHVVESIKIVISRSARMQSIISFISTLQFLNTVKLDHVIWKLQVYTLLLDKREDYHVNAHTECRLGKWYYTGEGSNFRQHVAWQQLEQPHAAVHTSGRRALETFFNHAIPEMTAELEKMEEASHQVVQLLDQLASDIQY
jgi:hypothetical protein